MAESLKKKAPNLVVPTSWVGKARGVIGGHYTEMDPKVNNLNCQDLTNG